MPVLRLVRPNEPFVIEPPATERPLPRWLWGIASCAGLALAAALLWWSLTADVRALRSLPDEQRLAIYNGTLDNLRNTCDPAPPRSLRDFCRTQAELIVKFRECDADRRCREVARRHLFQPRR